MRPGCRRTRSTPRSYRRPPSRREISANVERAPGDRGPLFSGSLSRILSGATIHLSGTSPEGPRSPRPCGLPGPRRAGSSVLLGLAPGGVCPAAASPRRRCALTAPFHLCLCARGRHRPYVSVALSRGFPRVGVTHRLALWCPDFPRGIPPAIALTRRGDLRTCLRISRVRLASAGGVPIG